MIRFSNVTKDFGDKRGVFALDFTLECGKIYGFLGKNGAGKSTTIKLLMSLLKPDSGEIFIDNKDISVFEHGQAAKKMLGYLPSDDYLFPHLSGRENLEYMSLLKTGDLHQYRALDHEIRELEMEEYLDEMIHSYSSGMLQKIHLLASLIGTPRILLWDEPHTGLDVLSNIFMHHILKTWISPERLVFFSSHILEMVENICDEVLIIHEGSIREIWKKEEGTDLQQHYLRVIQGH